MPLSSCFAYTLLHFFATPHLLQLLSSRRSGAKRPTLRSGAEAAPHPSFNLLKWGALS